MLQKRGKQLGKLKHVLKLEYVHQILSLLKKETTPRTALPTHAAHLHTYTEVTYSLLPGFLYDNSHTQRFFYINGRLYSAIRK